MIKFGHDGFQISNRRECLKGYDGVNVPKWNFEVESLVIQLIVQMEENTHELSVVW
jgi:hypothetical protein